MARNRVIQLTVVELEDINAQFVEAGITCLSAAIRYAQQNARTAADAQHLRNLLDAQRALLEAQRRLLEHHPERRE